MLVCWSAGLLVWKEVQSRPLSRNRLIYYVFGARARVVRVVRLQVASGQGYGHGNETAELRTFAGPSEIAPSQTFVLQAMEFSAKFAESFRFSYPVHVRCKWVCKCICPIRLHWQRVYIREVTLAAKRRSYTAKKKNL